MPSVPVARPSLLFSLAMAFPGPGGRARASSQDSSSGATNLTFVTLPLTPPAGRFGLTDQGELEASSKPNPNRLPSTPASSLLAAKAPLAFKDGNASFQYVSEKQQSRILSPSPSLARKPSLLSRGPSFGSRDGGHTPSNPYIRAYSMGSDMSPNELAGRELINHAKGSSQLTRKNSDEMYNSKGSVEGIWRSFSRIMRPGPRPSKKLLVLIVLNIAYSTVEFLIGLFTRRIGLVSDSFHLTFGCGVLTFSLFAMMWADRLPDNAYTYGYKRLEVLSAFTNALFLLFLSFSLAVEALHAFVQDEAEHKHYLILSAVTNLLVNLLGVWFFRSYARVHIVYRRSQDINLHSICLHVLSDSVRSAGVILASWLLTIGVTYAETICLGLVSVAIFMTSMPLFQASGAMLSQMAPSGSSAAALNKCIRQVRMLDDVVQCYNARFWDMVPGFIVGTLVMQVREGADEQHILRSVHSIYNDIGVKDLTVEIELYD